VKKLLAGWKEREDGSGPLIGKKKSHCPFHGGKCLHRPRIQKVDFLQEKGAPTAGEKNPTEGGENQGIQGAVPSSIT